MAEKQTVAKTIQSRVFFVTFSLNLESVSESHDVGVVVGYTRGPEALVQEELKKHDTTEGGIADSIYEIE
jgi:hypothetical protein